MEPRHDLTLELQDLILNASALVRLETNIYHVALHPSNLADLKSAIKNNLDSILYKFNPKFGGFLLGYKNVKVASDRGSLINDDFFIHFNIIADFYIFAPKVERVLYGIVNKKSPDHIGCLVHKFFNVSIPRPTRESRGDWLGASVEIGHKVTFVLKTCDFTGNLPYMQGSIISSCPPNPDDEALPESKKKKKFQYDRTQEDSFIISESQLDEISESLAKRKRETDDESGTNKKKKKKRKHKEEEENEEILPESNSLHMSSEDPSYGEVIEQIKESYLNENIQDIKKNNVKETVRNKKRKLYVQDEFTDVPQSLNSENIEEHNASEQIENKKKKRKKHHDTGEKSEIVLPDLTSSVENYKLSPQKLKESFTVSQKQSELTSFSRNMEKSSPSISHLLNKAKKMAGKETLRKKRKNKDENANLQTDSQEKHKKKKKKKKNNKKQDAVENSDIGITRIETSHKRSLNSSSLLKQVEEQTAEFEETIKPPNAVVEPGNNNKSEKKQASDVSCSSSILSRITTVYSDSDSDSSRIPNLSETSPYNLLRDNMVNAEDRKRVKLNKGNAMPERKSLPILPSYSSERDFFKSDNNKMAHSSSIYEELLTPPSPSSLAVNSISSSKPKKSVSFNVGYPSGLLSPDTYATPSDTSSQSLVKTQKSPKKRKLDAGENIVESSGIVTRREDPSMLKNFTSPSKSDKNKINKSPVQEPKTSMPTMESKILNKEEQDGNELEWKSKVPDFSNMLKILASSSKYSKSSRSPQSKKAAKNIVDVHNSREFKASTSPLKKLSASDLSNNEGQDTPDNAANVKSKDKHKVKNKDKDKSKLKKNKHKLKDGKKGEKKNKKIHEDKKDKKSKTTNKVDAKKSKKKKHSKNSGLDDLKKLSNELLQKYLKEKDAS